jgi:hypothetical protein
VGQLLQRVAPGGLLAALVPAGWLLDAEHAAMRGRWLEGATLQLSVQLPSFPVALAARPTDPAAVLVLRRGEGRGTAPLAFAPDRPVMGRFHLRSYLRTVLAAMPESANPPPHGAGG